MKLMGKRLLDKYSKKYIYGGNSGDLKIGDRFELNGKEYVLSSMVDSKSGTYGTCIDQENDIPVCISIKKMRKAKILTR